MTVEAFLFIHTFSLFTAFLSPTHHVARHVSALRFGAHAQLQEYLGESGFHWTSPSAASGSASPETSAQLVVIPSQEQTCQIIAELRDAHIGSAMHLLDGLDDGDATMALRDLTLAIGDDYQKMEWLKKVETNAALHNNHNSINPLLLFLKIITHFSVFREEIF